MTDYSPSPQVIAWAKAHGWNAEAHVEYFNNYVANMTRKPYKDPERAFRNAVISDWGNVRFKMTKDGTYWPKKQETRTTYQAPPPVEVTPEILAKIEQAKSILRR